MFPYFLRPFKEPINIEGISNYITHLCFTNTSKRSIYFSDFKYNNKIWNSLFLVLEIFYLFDRKTWILSP